MSEETNNFELKNYKNPNHFEIDFDKVNTIEDIKLVLDALGIVITKDSSSYNKLKDYLK